MCYLLSLEAASLVMCRLRGVLAKNSRNGSDGSGPDPLRVISLQDWGFGTEATGGVADIRWSVDNRAFTVGLKK